MKSLLFVLGLFLITNSVAQNVAKIEFAEIEIESNQNTVKISILGVNNDQDLQRLKTCLNNDPNVIDAIFDYRNNTTKSKLVLSKNFSASELRDLLRSQQFDILSSSLIIHDDQILREIRSKEKSN